MLMPKKIPDTDWQKGYGYYINYSIGEVYDKEDKLIRISRSISIRVGKDIETDEEWKNRNYLFVLKYR